MAGLGDTTASLARMRRHWEKLAAAMTAGHGTAAPAGGRLREAAPTGSNPGNLRMFVHVPEDCPPGAPLVVALHGCGQTAQGYDIGSGWSRLADRYGFALLLPEQQQANNRNTCFNWFNPADTRRGRGEALSIRQMVEQMAADHGIDRGRVHVTGLSAGGAMTTAMLACYPDVFASGAVLAGLPYGAAASVQDAFEAMYSGVTHDAGSWGDKVRAASRHSGPWPRISVWQGTSDTTVVPVNAAELIKQWTNLHGLGAAPDREQRVDGHPYRAWLGADGKPAVELYMIEGMGHGLPLAGGAEGLGRTGPFMLEAGISSSYRIARFFGLVDEAAVAAAPRPTREPAMQARQPAAPAREPAEQPKTASAFPDLDPNGVITAALRSAGLLKD